MSGSTDACVGHVPATSRTVYIMQKPRFCRIFWNSRTHRTHNDLVRFRTYLAHIPQYLNFLRRFYYPAMKQEEENLYKYYIIYYEN